MMKTSDFDFDLPQRLIAQYPAKKRGESRLLVLKRETGEIHHSKIESIERWLNPKTLIVLNNTKVRRARLYGKKIPEEVSKKEESTKKMSKPDLAEKETEFLLTEELTGEKWEVLVKRAKRQRIGDRYLFPGNIVGEIIDEKENTKIVKFSKVIDDSYLEKYGHTPLPPYIKRKDLSDDIYRYQTVYARQYGAIAAPTAGLHFTEEILIKLKNLGHEIAYITLHVGIGTFLPVRTEVVEKHRMHSERFVITEKTAGAVEKAKREGRDVLAVGTTVVRALESAWENGKLKIGNNRTNIFIYPGFVFKVTDRLLTNFHTPRSSLLMLVSAFSGRESILNAYKEAIRKEYRFFSYGDAMLIL